MTIRFLCLAAAAALLATAGCGEGGDATPAEAAPATKAAAAAPAGQRDWSRVVSLTPAGGYRMGNPDAPVKFVEYASLTCPHCADFNAAAHEPLKNDFVRGGRVSYEFRNFILNGPDLAMSMLLRCQQPAAFFPVLDAAFDAQRQWIEPFTKVSPADQQRIQSLPPERQLIAVADSGGLDQFFKLRGMPRARYEACLANKAGVDQLQKLRDEAVKQFEIQGTPTFVLNGEVVRDRNDWPGVRQAIEARL